jgi:enoyl-CoA hydratase/carnithine racemase
MAGVRRSPHARYTAAGKDGIGHLELTRSEKLNATDDDSVKDLDRAATSAARDKQARAIIVRGRGRAFCTGIDLSALAGDRLSPAWFRRWDVALARIESIPVATVAAIQGPCLGGGLQITLCCARAHRQGLVNRVVPLDRLDATALDLATKLAANVRAASVATKRLTLRSYDLSLSRFLTEYVRDQRACWNDRETRNTLARYRAGRWGK